ncbi:hypothetical protein COP2_033691 [Malus domestica]
MSQPAYNKPATGWACPEVSIRIPIARLRFATLELDHVRLLESLVLGFMLAALGPKASTCWAFAHPISNSF